MTKERAITGCILGTAVGDAIGLPSEGLAKQRLRKLFPEPYRHRFLFGRGMVSDDTEHTIMVAQALIASAGDTTAFSQDLARRLKRWILLFPGATGMATLKACLRLLIGYGPQNSGVFSAGNGPAMRSAVIGVCYGSDLGKMRELVRISTRITHTDRKAEYGALAVALAAHLSAESGAEVSSKDYLKQLAELLGTEGQDLLELVGRAVESAEAGRFTESFAEDLGWSRGVSGYIYSTVPAALHAWFRHPKDFGEAVSEVIRCGGDTDSTAAIVGAIVGAGVGTEGIPTDWLDGLIEWPRTVEWMKKLARQLATAVPSASEESTIGAPGPLVLLRNIMFVLVVVLHGLRRLLPPYWFCC